MSSQTIKAFLDEWHNASDRVLVKTSGSTGNPQLIWVQKEKMKASARITCDFLGLCEGDAALLCMSLDYIAGKMMVVRAIVRRLRLFIIEPTGHPMAETKGLMYDFSSDHVVPQSVTLPAVFSFGAMVPLQVFNTLQVPIEKNRLMNIQHLIIGGGGINEQMAKELKQFPCQVWSTYGMTETLSHIALRPLSGDSATEWYSPFEGVHLSLSEDNCLIIDAPAVCEGQLQTNDIAELADDGSSHFRIIGRKDNVICSGGVKIQIEEVEQRLQPLMPVPFMVTKQKDEKFGEVPVLLYESDRTCDWSKVIAVLPRYWQPRLWMRVDHIPMTATGKPARKQAEVLVMGGDRC